MAVGLLFLREERGLMPIGSRGKAVCGQSVWNALHIRLPVEKYLTSQHHTPHVVRPATQASCYTGIKQSHANRQRDGRC